MEKILEPRLTEMTDRSFCPIFLRLTWKETYWRHSCHPRGGARCLIKGTFQEDGFSALRWAARSWGRAEAVWVGWGQAGDVVAPTKPWWPCLVPRTMGRKGPNDRRAKRGRQERLSVLCLRKQKECDEHSWEVEKSRTRGWLTWVRDLAYSHAMDSSCALCLFRSNPDVFIARRRCRFILEFGPVLYDSRSDPNNGIDILEFVFYLINLRF